MQNLTTTPNPATATDNEIKYVDLPQARIQWDVPTLNAPGPDTFDFTVPYEFDSPAVVVNRTQANADQVLDVTHANQNDYTLASSSHVSGEQIFNMLSVGRQNQNVVNYAAIEQSGETIGVIQWGIESSTTDGNQEFSFPTHFNMNCAAVLTTPMQSGQSDNLPVVSATNSNFTINRATAVSGTQPFYWVAIGDCQLSSNNSFSVELGDGIIMKGGMAKTTTDGEENIPFSSLGLDNYTEDCYTLVTTRKESGCKNGLPVVSQDKYGFTLDRSSSTNGTEYFYWIAIGK